MKVFVHGVPETGAVWSPLVAALNTRGVDDVVVLSPPGFGEPVPTGWTPNPTSYVAWLAAELAQLRERGATRIDLVGHDWGTGHVLGLLVEHPGLVDTWATDCPGLIHPDYEWHDAAQSWQTDGVGEETFAATMAFGPDAIAEVYVSMGMTPEVAEQVASALDQDMVDCILGLYRAAKQPVLANLGDQLAVSDLPPGLFLIATEDTYAGSVEMAGSSADRLGVTSRTLDGAGHWWMCEQPDAAADHLLTHWK